VSGELTIESADLGEQVPGQRLAFDGDGGGRADASQDAGGAIGP
jgi:hypothetical protein